MSSNPDLYTIKPPDNSTPLKITTMEQNQTTNTQQLQVGKHQMLPVVVIQTQPNQKLTSSSNNMITLPQILPMQHNQMQMNQMVLGKTPIVLQKGANLQNMAKNGVTYLTMLKPVSKPPDSVLSAARIPITTISKLKNDNIQTIQNVQNLQNLQVLNSNNQTRVMITPMPSVTTNRLPVTMTTNSVQSKISFMPMVCNNKGKIINLKLDNVLANNLVHNSSGNSLGVKKEELGMSMPSLEAISKPNTYVDLSTANVASDLTITAVPDDKDVKATTKKLLEIQDDRSYQLSIVEDENVVDIDLERQLNENLDDNVGESEDKTVTSCNSKVTPPIRGVSILKRSFPFGKCSDNPQTPKIPAVKTVVSNPNVDTIITISDPKTKEVQISTSAIPDLAPLSTNSSTPIKEEIVEPLPALPQTPVPVPTTKRSRKSTLCLRKDFHEFEIQVSTKGKALKKLDLEEEKRHDMEVDEINSQADPFNFSSLIDDEIIKSLDWKQSVGKLPGSNLKFFVNEFGFLEYLTQDEYNKMFSKGSKTDGVVKKKKKEKLSPAEEQEEMRCLECGCFGMASEFINPKYCSLECHAVGEKKAVDDPANHKKVSRKNSTNSSSSQNNSNSSSKKRKLESENCGNGVSSDDDGSVKTEASMEGKYPWHCRTKGFSWSKYLAHINAIGAPVKLFKDAFPYNRNGFRPGMKLEGIDPLHPSYFCVMSVSAVQGYRLQLHFDGYPKNYDFWTNADSMDIFPAGFCEKHDHMLHPPPNFQDFNWVSYLKHTKSTVAPKNLFSNRTGSAIFPTGFRVGMKLEAVDRKNTSLVCVATAKDLMDNRILVHFDSWDDIYDYWADPTSPYIHPVGWCDKNGHNLTPPNDYPDPENFTWEKYLKETNAVAAPVRAFKQRPLSGFRKGMRLECVDKRVPQYVRVACVVEVKNNRLRVAFDGWPDRYSYWVDDDSPDIHPVGWCQKTGHSLEPPLTPDDVYDFMDCATIGCRGVGNMKGPIFTTHATLKYCPYAEDNIDIESLLPDRLLSPDREPEAVVPISREPRTKKTQKKKCDSTKQESDWTNQEPTMSDIAEIIGGSETPIEDKEDVDSKEFKEKSLDTTPAPSSPASIKSELSIKKEQSPSISSGLMNPQDEEEELNIEEMHMRNKHSKYFKSFTKCKTDPTLWTTKKVVQYVQSLPFAKHNADIFTTNAIDGESFLMLTQEELVDVLQYKLGPAIALYNCILLLRKNVNAS